MYIVVIYIQNSNTVRHIGMVALWIAWRIRKRNLHLAQKEVPVRIVVDVLVVAEL